MSERIQLEGLVFEQYINAADIQNRIAALATDLNRRHAATCPVLLPVLSGAFWFSAQLVQLLSIDYRLDFVRVSSYKGGTQSTGEIELVTPPRLELKGQHVLLIEDIVDSGLTLDYLVDYLQSAGAQVQSATLFHKPNAHKGQVQPDWVGFEIDDAFVVGCGLDYQERGRGLDALFQLQPGKPK